MIIGGNALSQAYRDILEPFRDPYTYKGMSGGVSNAGYDIAVEFDARGFQRSITLASGVFVLASSIECFNMPINLVGIVHDKSSWARRGLTVQNTVIEPGWRGHLTLELHNHSRQALTIHEGQPIAQVLFHEIRSAAPYDGKYQDQERGPVAAR